MKLYYYLIIEIKQGSIFFLTKLLIVSVRIYRT